MKIKSHDAAQPEHVPYSYLDAAEKVLDAQPHKSPMHHKKITQLALETGRIFLNAKAPARALHACIWADTKKEAPSRFIMDTRTYTAC